MTLLQKIQKKYKKPTEESPNTQPIMLSKKHIQTLQELQDFLQFLKSPRRIIWQNLLSGFFKGIGWFLGLTVGVALLIALFQKIVDFPLVGEYFERLLQILEQNTQNLR